MAHMTNWRLVSLSALLICLVGNASQLTDFNSKIQSSPVPINDGVRSNCKKEVDVLILYDSNVTNSEYSAQFYSHLTAAFDTAITKKHVQISWAVRNSYRNDPVTSFSRFQGNQGKGSKAVADAIRNHQVVSKRDFALQQVAALTTFPMDARTSSAKVSVFFVHHDMFIDEPEDIREIFLHALETEMDKQGIHVQFVLVPDIAGGTDDTDEWLRDNTDQTEPDDYRVISMDHPRELFSKDTLQSLVDNICLDPHKRTTNDSFPATNDVDTNRDDEAGNGTSSAGISQWADWGGWSDCMTESRERYRYCITSESSLNTPCEGEVVEKEKCSMVKVQCGIRNRDRRRRSSQFTEYTGKGIGMNQIGIEKAPWMAKVTHMSLSMECGSSIISSNYALTAAHCFCSGDCTDRARSVKDADQYLLGVGHEDVTKATTVHIKSVQLHPNWSGDYVEGNDIAIIATNEDMFNYNNVVPICLPRPQQCYHTGTQLSLAGWGKYNKKRSRDELVQSSSKKLRHTRKLKIHDFRSCQQESDIAGTHDVLCVKSADGKARDACKGDSGGPLFVKDLGRFYVYGIVSYGSLCENTLAQIKNVKIREAHQRGVSEEIGFYTRVTAHLPWIHENTVGLYDSVSHTKEKEAEAKFDEKWPRRSGVCVDRNTKAPPCTVRIHSCMKKLKNNKFWSLATLPAKCPDNQKRTCQENNG